MKEEEISEAQKKAEMARLERERIIEESKLWDAAKREEERWAFESRISEWVLEDPSKLHTSQRVEGVARLSR